MYIDDEINQLVRQGLEHWIANRNKEQAINNALSKLQDIGFVDWLKEKLSLAIDELNAEESDNMQLAMDRVLSQTLVEQIGYEPTETDIPIRPAKAGADCLEAPEPLR